MVAQPKNTNNQDDSQRRFQEARDRYNKLNQGKYQTESLASDSDADEVMMATTLDYLRKLSDQNKAPRVSVKPVKADNSNKVPGLPVPLPVVPVAPEQLIVQEKTNKLIDRLAKNTSRESTLKVVVETLVLLTSQIERFTQTIIDKFGDISGHWTSRFEQYTDEQKKASGWMTRLVGKLIGRDPDHHTMSFAEALEVFTKPIIKATRGTFDLLQKQFKFMSAANRKERMDAIRGSVTDEDGRPGMFSGMSETLFPKNSIIRTAIDFVKGIGTFFTDINKVGKEKLGAAQGGFLGAIAGIASGGIIGKFLTLMTGLFSSVAVVVGSAVFASVYSMFKNPDQFYRMMSAFGTFFTEVVTPALAWITKEILPPISIAFAALMVVADKLLETVGTVINESLIWILGTALPETFKILGKQIDIAWQTIKKLFWRIAGIFGVGEHGETGIFQNLLMMVIETVDGLMELASVIPTRILQAFNIDELIGLQDGESLYGRLKRFIVEDIPNFLVKIFDTVMAYISEFHPIEWIKKKLDSIIEYFTGGDEEQKKQALATIKDMTVGFFEDFINLLTGWIPTWEDMKGWLRSIIPEGTPGVIKNWLLDQLGSAQDAAANAIDAGKDIANQAYKNNIDPTLRDIQRSIDSFSLSPWANSNSGAPVIIAPQTNNTTNNNMSGGGASINNIGIGSTTAPLSRLDEMIFRANPF